MRGNIRYASDIITCAGQCKGILKSEKGLKKEISARRMIPSLQRPFVAGFICPLAETGGAPESERKNNRKTNQRHIRQLPIERKKERNK